MPLCPTINSPLLVLRHCLLPSLTLALTLTNHFNHRKARRNLPVTDLRKAARKPWRNLNHHALNLMHSALAINLPGTGTSITPGSAAAPITKTPINSSGDLQVVILD